MSTIPAQLDTATKLFSATDGINVYGGVATSIVPVATTASATPTSAQWLAGMPKDANGFASPVKSSGYRVVYVANAGKDTNNGLTPQTPVATLPKAYSIARAGSDDEIRLNCGDKWDCYANGGMLPYAGKSPWQPFVFSNYGDATKGYPTLLTQYTFNHPYVLMTGINCHCVGRDTTIPGWQVSIGYGGYCGISISAQANYIWIEDCDTKYFQDNMDVQGTATAPLGVFIYRRNRNAYSWAGAKSQGLYVNYVNDALIQENVSVHDGWNATAPGAAATIFSHAFYLQTTNGPVNFEYNLATDAGSYGCEGRTGGDQSNNYFFRQPYGSFVSTNTSTVDKNIYENVGQALQIIGNNASIDGCIFLNQGSAGTVKNTGSCVNLTPAVNGVATPTMAVTLTNSVAHAWNGPGIQETPLQGQTWNGLTQSGNDFVGSGSYVDPTRCIGTYATSLGLASADAMLAAMLANTRANWNPKLTPVALVQWVQAGFAKK